MPDTSSPGTFRVAPIVDFALVPEVGDAPADTTTPYSMAVGDIFQGTVGVAGDEDFVAITLTAGVTYTISLTGQGLTNGLSDPYLELYAGNGTTLLAVDDNGGSLLNSLITFTPTTTGTYYIDATAFGTTTGDYALTVNEPNTNASFEALVEYLTDGYWEDSTRNTHAFDTSVSNVITVDLNGLTADGIQLARWAMEAWENVADINFVEVVGGGQITFTDDGAGLGAGAGFVASGTTTTSSTINITQGWLTTFGTTIGSYSLQTYIHELGHSLGLGHLGSYNNSATYGIDNTFRDDSWSNSIMSYFDQTDNTTITNSFARLVGAGMIDIGAIQNLYGASTGGNSAGNSTWGYNSNLGGYMGTLFASMLDGPASASVSGGPVMITVHDVGGTDTLDFSGETVGMTLNLNAETWSTIDSFRGTSGAPSGNLTIARGTVIENATGGSGNDSISGNVANNLLLGGAGDDTLSGGDGNDSLIGGPGADTMHGGNGTDTVSYAGSTTGVGARLDGIVGWGGATGDTIFTVENLIGSAHRDTLVGNSGANQIEAGGGGGTIWAGGGDDTLIGGSGADRLNGGNGTDTVSYAGSATGVGVRLDGLAGWGGALGDTIFTVENLIGSAHRDTLVGSGAANRIEAGDGGGTIWAGGGDDTLIGGSGADRLNGGNGNDTADYSASGSGVTIQLGNGPGTGGDAAGDVLSGIENLIGSALGDWLAGDAFANRLEGGAGDDFLLGNGGNDMLIGGLAADTLTGGGGADRMFGGDDRDTFVGGNDGDAVDGGTGGDDHDILDLTGLGRTVIAGQTIDADGDSTSGTINFLDSGGAVTGSMAFGEIEEIIRDPYLAGAVDGLDSGENMGPGYTDLQGDMIDGADGDDDTIFGNGGDDTIDGGVGDDTVDGGSGDDTIYGGAGSDVLEGGPGNDTLVLSQSVVGERDVMSGGANTDTADFSLFGSAVWVGLGNAGGEARTNDTGDVGPTEDNNGRSGASVFRTIADLISIENLTGTAFNDWLIGDASNNALQGGLGNDVLEGGQGDDVLEGGLGDDVLFGGADNDLLIGGGDDDSLNGGDGNDTLDGGVDSDILNGGAGSDTMTGGSGADFFIFSPGQDVITDFLDDVDKINLGYLDFLGGSLTAQQIVDTYGSIVAGNAVLNFRVDRLTVNGVTDLQVLVNDLQVRVHEVLIENPTGTAFDDWLIGDAGNNVLQGGPGDDVLEGGDGNDQLFGGADNDLLIGGGDDDTLDGGDGNDMLDGGDGADIFVFGAGLDVISDFLDNIDTIVLQLDVLKLDPFSDSSLTAQQIVDTYGSIVAGNAVLNFGVDRLTVNGVTDLQVLVNDLL